MFNDFYYSLSEKEVIIFNFISSNIAQICNMSIKELSLKLSITEYSINKFCKKLNVDNYENLTSILKDISKDSLDSSSYIFKNSLDIFSSFVKKINESQIEKMCNLILKYDSVLILFSDSSKLVAQYLNEKLNDLNINARIISSAKQILKQKESELIIFIGTCVDENSMKKNIHTLSNKIVITILDKIIKEIHDNSTIFVYIDNNKLYKNFNLYCTSPYFIFCDLVISKLIELCNNKK